MNLTDEINGLSLSEAIEKLRANYSGLTQGDEDESKSWFLNHDATHVIFGTIPFDIKGETFNDIWTIFGSTVSLKGYSEFFNFTTPSKVFSSYGGVIKVFLAFVILIPGCIRVFINTRRMTKNWPWDVTETLLLKKVGDLRKEFNIQLV